MFNDRFEPAKAEYSGRYEETQDFSPRFREFQRDLATRWVDEHGLAGKTVLEIGCGKGTFLVEMCRAGAGRGIGIDPAVAPERLADDPAAARVEWIAEKFDEHWLGLEVDAVVCRHTLEHIAPVADFMTLVRRLVGDRDIPVLFELPDALRVLREGAFWDVYYEHCSYFTPGSLARLFRRTGFDVTDVRLDYDDQYILVEARPAATTPGDLGAAGDRGGRRRGRGGRRRVRRLGARAARPLARPHHDDPRRRAARSPSGVPGPRGSRTCRPSARTGTWPRPSTSTRTSRDGSSPGPGTRSSRPTG